MNDEKEKTADKKQLTNDDMEKLNRAQIAALIAKLKSGTPLSTAQMKMLDEARKAGEKIPEEMESKWPKSTKSDARMKAIIREAFEISEDKAYKWLRKLHKMKKAATGWGVNDVLRVIADRKETAAGGGALNNDLKRQMMQEQIAILKCKREEAEGRLLEADRVNELVAKQNAGYRGAIESWRQYTIARHPHLVLEIESCADNLIKMMRDTLA